MESVVVVVTDRAYPPGPDTDTLPFTPDGSPTIATLREPVAGADDAYETGKRSVSPASNVWSYVAGVGVNVTPPLTNSAADKRQRPVAAGFIVIEEVRTKANPDGGVTVMAGDAPAGTPETVS